MILIPGKQILKEEITATDKETIKSEVKRSINSGDLKDIITKLVNQEVKANKELEEKTYKIVQDSMVKLFQALYNQRGFWEGKIKK